MTAREATARWRANNPQAALKSSARAKTTMRKRVADYKAERGCEECAISDPRVLDLHHRSGEQKTLAVSQMMYRFSWGKVLAEMGKCQVLCANCHRIEHADDGEIVSDVQMTTGIFFRAS